MSGRLVILPHKSWNVWNRDNQEKVLRDERIHRENEEKRQQNEDKLLQEQNLEALTRTEGDEKVTTVQPFRLFEDLEQKYFRELGNEEYLKEKAAEERRKQQKDGTAAWSLGTSDAHIPWYARATASAAGKSSDVARVVDRVLGKTSINQQVLNEMINDSDQSKQQADPMNNFLVHSTASHELISINESKTDLLDDDDDDGRNKRSNKIIDNDTKNDNIKRKRHRHDESIDDEENDQILNKKNKKHRNKKDKERKRKKHKEHQYDDHNRKKKDNQNNNILSLEQIEELRKRRLEREVKERKRVATLLAHSDIYGSNSLMMTSHHHHHEKSSSYYHQQFHPHIIQQNHNKTSQKY